MLLSCFLLAFMNKPRCVVSCDVSCPVASGQGEARSKGVGFLWCLGREWGNTLSIRSEASAMSSRHDDNNGTVEPAEGLAGRREINIFPVTKPKHS